MPLTTSEVIINLTEDIETLLGYIRHAQDEGIDFGESFDMDLSGINHDLEVVYDEDYCDIELMEDDDV